MFAGGCLFICGGFGFACGDWLVVVIVLVVVNGLVGLVVVVWFGCVYRSLRLAVVVGILVVYQS